jgi:hypothetical protein
MGSSSSSKQQLSNIAAHLLACNNTMRMVVVS